MAGINKSALLTEVNARTSRTETDIDRVFKSILMDVSNSWPFLEKRQALTFVQLGQPLPSDYLRVITVQQSTGAPMDRIDDVTQWWALMTADASVGTPTRFALFNDLCYLYPNFSIPLSLSVIYNYQADDPDSNPFDDPFDECLIEGTCFKVLESHGLLGETETAKAHLDLYREQLAKLQARYSDRSW